jgi:formate/nitrite transporter FocA (FNT family)
MLVHLPGYHYAIDTAVSKTFHPFGVMVVRGLLANWLVSYQGNMT